MLGHIDGCAAIDPHSRKDDDLAERILDGPCDPDCRLFAWQVGEAYKKLERWEDAVRVFTALAAVYEDDPRDDGSGPLRCWWKLAVLAKSVGKPDDCAYYCGKVLALAERPGFDGRPGLRERHAERIVTARSWATESPEKSE